MARIYEYELKWSKAWKTGRDRLNVYRMKNGKCVKSIYARELEVLVNAGIIDDPKVKEWLADEKEFKEKREALKAAKGEDVAKPKVLKDDGGGFAPRSKELYDYLAGLYKIKTWGSV
ncbi:MAG TPA: hypothetical protein VK175_06145 [Leadbetterella sp.]|nr:hypothetical protein [Leadbetterella sp.]